MAAKNTETEPQPDAQSDGVTTEEERTEALEPEVLDDDGQPIGEDLDDGSGDDDDPDDFDEYPEDELEADAGDAGDDTGSDGDELEDLPGSPAPDDELVEPENVPSGPRRTSRAKEGLDGARRYSKAQSEINAIIQSINTQMPGGHRRRGPKPKYRLRIWRRFPPDAQCWCPSLPVDLSLGYFDLEVIGELYGGGIYDVVLLEGRKKVDGAVWHGLPYGGEPTLLPGEGRLPGQQQTLYYGQRESRVIAPQEHSGSTQGNSMTEALERITEGMRDMQELTAEAMEKMSERIDSARQDPVTEMTQAMQNIILMKQGMDAMFPQPKQEITGEGAAAWAAVLNMAIEKGPQLLAGLSALGQQGKQGQGQQSVPQERSDGLRPVRVLDIDDDADAESGD